MQEEEQLILRRELLGDTERSQCALCQHIFPLRELQLIPGDEVGLSDVEFVSVCHECLREFRSRDHLLPPES